MRASVRRRSEWTRSGSDPSLPIWSHKRAIMKRSPEARSRPPARRSEPVINVSQAGSSDSSATLPCRGRPDRLRARSTTEQSPTLQLDALQAAGCERVFTEEASGAVAERPELARALDHLRPVDTLVVWKLDRLGRSLRHLIDTVRGLEDRGVGFCSLQEQVDTTTPGGHLVFHVFGALAECERDLIRERTHAGLAAARGRRGGRPTVMTPESSRPPASSTTPASTPSPRSPRPSASAEPASTGRSTTRPPAPGRRHRDPYFAPDDTDPSTGPSGGGSQVQHSPDTVGCSTGGSRRDPLRSYAAYGCVRALQRAAAASESERAGGADAGRLRSRLPVLGCCGSSPRQRG